MTSVRVTAPYSQVDGVKYLDAGVVNFNRRDKKLYKRPMTFIRTEEMKEKGVVKPRIDMYMQSSFKYILYIEGHCAAMRYASMMPLGAVILKVESECTADLIWYFPLLKPFDINNPEEDTTAGMDLLPAVALQQELLTCCLFRSYSRP